jgi:succinate dehydrogenase hydrophobic anchor subunit
MVRSRTVPRRALSLEYAMWIFTRVSGAAMLILGVLGMAGALYMGARTQMDLGTLMRWTFFPNPSHVVNSNIPDVNLGWTNIYWRVMQLLVVFFGVTHGFNGLRVVMEDYITREAIRRALRWVVLLLWVVVMVVAVAVVFTT